MGAGNDSSAFAIWSTRCRLIPRRLPISVAEIRLSTAATLALDGVQVWPYACTLTRGGPGGAQSPRGLASTYTGGTSMSNDTTAPTDEQVRTKPWTPKIPAYALASEAGTERYTKELSVRALAGQFEEFRKHLVRAAIEGRACFFEHVEAFSSGEDGPGDEATALEGLLARALLLVATAVEEATGTLEHDIDRLVREAPEVEEAAEEER